MLCFLLAFQPPPDPDVVAAAAAAAAAVLKTAESTRNAWSDPLVIGMVGGQAILIIGAIGSAVALILNRATVRELKEQAQMNSANIVTVRADTEAIKGHVNSEKTAAEGRELALRQENVLLREMITEKKLTAQLLAQAVATRGRAPDGSRTSDTPAKVEVVNTPEVVVTNTPLLVKGDEGDDEPDDAA